MPVYFILGKVAIYVSHNSKLEVDKKLVGTRIKKIRLKLGETAEVFGKHFDPPANRGLVSGWENGRYLPSPERIKAIAEIGNIKVTELLYGNVDDYVLSRLRDIHDIHSENFDSSIYKKTCDFTKVYNGINYSQDNEDFNKTESEIIIDDFLPTITSALVEEFNISFEDSDEKIISKYLTLLKKMEDNSLNTYESITNYLYHHIFTILDQNTTPKENVSLEEYLQKNTSGDKRDLINQYFIGKLLFKLADDISESNLDFLKTMENEGYWITGEDGELQSKY